MPFTPDFTILDMSWSYPLNLFVTCSFLSMCKFDFDIGATNAGGCPEGKARKTVFQN
jgi:hypothetical protein